jgi:hypothetical protein
LESKHSEADDMHNCPHACDKRDCDGDWDTYCLTGKPCGYKRNVRDCDGDVISLCRRKGTHS